MIVDTSALTPSSGSHRAQLNFGDCLAYAVARVADDALLFTGDEFPATDLTAA